MSDLNHFYLTLVRHGETEGNRLRKAQGITDEPLNDTGVKQAQRLSQHMTGQRFALIYASDLCRALDTAKIVVKGEEGIKTDVRLREMCLGELEGRDVTELKNLLLNECTPKGGESPADVSARVVDFITGRLMNDVSNGDSVLIVSHGALIHHWLCYMRDGLKCHLNEPLRFGTPNTGVTQFKVFYNRCRKMISAECLKLNDVRHLEGGIGEI